MINKHLRKPYSENKHCLVGSNEGKISQRVFEPKEEGAVTGGRSQGGLPGGGVACAES